MGITRLGHTLAANPRRKRRNPQRGASGRFVRAGSRKNPGPRKGRRKSAAASARVLLPSGKARRKYGATSKGGSRVGTLVIREVTTKKGKSRTAAKVVRSGVKKGSSWQAAGGVYKRANRKKGQTPFYLTKNPGGLVFAGVDIIPAAAGALAAVVFGHAGNAAVAKWAKGKLGPVEPYVGPLTILAASWAAQKYVRNPMIQTGAKYAAIAAIFMLVDKMVNDPIKDAVGKAFGVTLTGTYVDIYNGEPALGGMYMSPAMGYEQQPAGVGGFADGMSGLGLFQSQPLYG
jgi:hypothetical protein